MKRIIKSKKIIKKNQLIKIHFNRKFFKSTNTILKEFKMDFTNFEKTNNLIIGKVYELETNVKKRRIRREDEKDYVQYYSIKDKLINKHEIIENKFVKFYYGDIITTHEIYTFEKGNEEIESGSDFSI